MSPEVPKPFVVEKRRIVRRPEVSSAPQPEVRVTVEGIKHLKGSVWRGIVTGTINGKEVNIEVTWHPERKDPETSRESAAKFGIDACRIAREEAHKVFVGRMENPRN